MRIAHAHSLHDEDGGGDVTDDDDVVEVVFLLVDLSQTRLHSLRVADREEKQFPVVVGGCICQQL